MNRAGERLYNGMVKENPTFVLMLGMCPTLAVTTSAINGLGMGLTTMVVLALSNLFISLLRKVIPNRVRIPAFIVIIATFVTVVQLLLEAYLPFLNKALGVYIPLIVVNCIILGRAEAYAYSNPPIPSLFDGIGMGLGFSIALTCIGAVRELLGAGKLFGVRVTPDSLEPIRIFGQAPGAFFVLACLVALQNYVKNKLKKAGKPYEKIGSGCTEDCMNCSEEGCARRFYDEKATRRRKAEQRSEKSEQRSEKSEKKSEKAESRPEKSEKKPQKSEQKPEKSEQKSQKSMQKSKKPSGRDASGKRKKSAENPAKGQIAKKTADDLEVIDLEKEDK